MRGLNTLRSVVRKVLGVSCLEDRTPEQRLAIWPAAATLQDRHLQNCRVVADRSTMLKHLPQHATCAEIGVWKGDFAQSILATTLPTKLHLIDFSPDAVAIANRRFAAEIASGQVAVHHGDSASTIRSFNDAYFDWVYIDADHSYAGVKADLAAVRTKLKPGGLIALNDYIYFSSIDFAKYGVVEAVHEFCLEHDYEMICLALNPRMNNDVLLRPIA